MSAPITHQVALEVMVVTNILVQTVMKIPVILASLNNKLNKAAQKNILINILMTNARQVQFVAPLVITNVTVLLIANMLLVGCL